MKKKAIIPLLLMVALSACETPWYRLQKENDELRAENQRLMSEASNNSGISEKQLYDSQAKLASAQAEISRLKEQNDKTTKELRAALEGTGAAVTTRDGKPAIVLPNGILFNSGKHEVNSKGQSTLKQVANALNGKYGKLKISVQGHTDSDPIRKSKYADNYQLSAERARSVLNYLSKSGIDAKRLQGAFFGPHRPLSTTKSKNRRVELVLFN